MAKEKWTYSKCRCGDPICKSFHLDFSGAEGMVTEEQAKLICAAPGLLDVARDAVAELQSLANARPDEARRLGPLLKRAAREIANAGETEAKNG